jgi:tetratricopeptide (TPR) repeat protein
VADTDKKRTSGKKKGGGGEDFSGGWSDEPAPAPANGGNPLGGDDALDFADIDSLFSDEHTNARGTPRDFPVEDTGAGAALDPFDGGGSGTDVFAVPEAAPPADDAGAAEWSAPPEPPPSHHAPEPPPLAFADPVEEADPDARAAAGGLAVADEPAPLRAARLRRGAAAPPPTLPVRFEDDSAVGTEETELAPEIPPPPPPRPAPPPPTAPPPAPSTRTSARAAKAPPQRESLLGLDEPADAPVAPAEEPSVFNDKGLFRAESQRLARARDWQGLAGLTSAVLDGGSWAAVPETRAALLADLGRLYRDRLKDLPSAEDAFKKLAELEPASNDALAFLSDRFEERQDWRALYDLYGAAIEATWDEGDRLAWTQKTAELALDKIGSRDLAIEAWERLFRLGDAVEEASRELSIHYRKAARWDRLAEFLAQRAETFEGVRRVVALREVSEAYLSGLRDHERAAIVLDEITALRPGDPVALLAKARVAARRRDWEALRKLADAPTGKKAPKPGSVEAAALLDLRRVVADALWSGEEHERAVSVYDLILESEPDDKDALAAKQEFLSKAGKLEELVELLARRASEATTEAERGRLLERAAEIAEKDLGNARLAVGLWERRAREVSTGRPEAYAALAALYESLGDAEGLRGALEGQLQLVRRPSQRIELLRQLGDHCAHRLSDDARAEACWREILATVPDDPHVRQELVQLYRRRGDFEALDRTFAAHAWRPLDDGALGALWRQAAENVQENLGDPARAVRAWLRVTDLSPDDAAAREALVMHHRALGRPTELVAALEAALRAGTASPSATVERLLEIASLWEGEGDTQAAVAAYERVLRVDAANPTALAQLGKLRRAQPGIHQGVLDHAVTTVDGEARRRLVEESVALVAADDALGRFFAARRVLQLAGPDGRLVEETRAAAEKANAWAELAAVYLELGAEATDPTERAQHHRALAALYETQLKDPVRAFLTLQAARQEPVGSLDELDPLVKLAQATGRHEDHLALLDVAARSGAPLAVKKEALRRRAAICEKELKDEERAFHEVVRVLRLDARDADALAEAKRLAAAKKLWRPLDALYAELWDRAATTEERVAIARARHDVRETKLKDANAALEQLLVIYRLAPTEEVEGQLILAAEQLKAWDHVLPLMEARVRTAGLGDDQAATELARLGALNEDTRSDRARAFELYGEAFVRRPMAAEIEAKCEALASATGRWAELAGVLRQAAARAGDPMRQLELYRKVANVYSEKLQRTDLALDVHRRILSLQPTALASLEVVIDHQRQAGLYRELRDSLQAWLDAAVAAGKATDADRVARWLEIARISKAELGDAETALATYAQVLDVDAANAEALAGIRSLTEGVIDPQLEVRRLGIELSRTQGPRRAEILLRQAEILERDLDDVETATLRLTQLVEEAGADGPGYAPLAALFEKGKKWGELVDLMELRAETLASPAERREAFERAVAIAEEHAAAVGPGRRERLSRRILEIDAADPAARRRLLSLYRGRSDDATATASLAALIEGMIPTATPKERRLLEDELVRLYDRALNRSADAEKLGGARHARLPDDGDTCYALASLALRRGDVARALALRERTVRLVPARLGALIHCHLAEAADERGGDAQKVLEHYRQARALDPANQPAMEALKAIGRRVKSWRQQAALLNDSDEKSLPWSERARRLCDRGDACAKDDPAVAQSWYERAVAVDPDCDLAWEALARLAEAAGDRETALRARRAAVAAFERATAPISERAREHAERIQALADALAATGDEEAAAEAALLSRKAYDLLPSLASAALAVADRRLAEGVADEAYRIYDRVLGDAASLSARDRLHAHFQRGSLAARLGKLDQAIGDLREGLRIDELHSGLLTALAGVLAEKGRVTAAIQHFTQALLLASEEVQRGALYARLGRLWEDRLAQLDEAGVCYDLAIGSGVDEAELMRRALSHYRRSGQTDRALAVIEQLLPATQKPNELASLWAERGHILATQDEDKAMEAFDMALSYDPGCGPAVNGLALLLEKRGDWKQLVEMLEVQAESGARADRADALRHLARISAEHLGDRARAERFLQQVIDLAPQREDWESLLALYGDDPRSDEKRKEALAGLLALSGPYMPRLIELGRSLVADGRRRWAWCVLSPLMSSTMPDPQLKSLVLELRKEFEKAENVAALSPETHHKVRHRDLSQALVDVLVELDARVPIGPATPEDVGASGLGKLDLRTAVGKTFAGIAERLGLEGATLVRAQELSVPFRVLDPAEGNGPATIVAKSDLFQLLSPAETNALFATMLEAARPGARVVNSLGSDAGALVPALLAAVGLLDAAALPPGAALALSETIRAGVDAETRARWAEALAGEPLGGDAAERGARVAAALIETARRVGLVAAADLRFTAKLLTRLDEALPKLPTAGKIEDLDEFFAGAAPVRSLVGFSVSPQFGRALEGG